MTTTEILTTLLQLHNQVKSIPPILWEQVQPKSKIHPNGHSLFTGERLRGGVSAIQCAQLLGLRIVLTNTSLSTSAFVCSGHQAQAWYLVSLEFPKNDFWTAASYSCPCTAGKTVFCHHSVALLLAVNLLQSLPSRRPQWCQIPKCLPKLTSRNTSLHYKVTHQGQPYYEEDAQRLLFFMTQNPPHKSVSSNFREDLKKHNDREKLSFIFTAKQKKKPNQPRPYWKTGSWRKALQIQISRFPTPAYSQQSTLVPAQPATAPRQRICSRCGRPLKGHRRSQPCPSVSKPVTPEVEPASPPPAPHPALPPPSDSPPTPQEQPPPEEQPAAHLSESRKRRERVAGDLANHSSPRKKRSRGRLG